MKQQLTALLIFCSLTLFTVGCKKENGSAGTPVPVTVIKHCSGNYLRYEGKDYFICNGNIAAPFADGTTGMAIFTTIPHCKNPEATTLCQAVHAHEGFISVAELK